MDGFMIFAAGDEIKVPRMRKGEYDGTRTMNARMDGNGRPFYGLGFGFGLDGWGKTKEMVCLKGHSPFNANFQEKPPIGQGPKSS